MKISGINNIKTFTAKNDDIKQIETLISQLGKGMQYPNTNRNYCIYNEQRVNKLASYKEKAIKPLSDYISTSMDMNGVIEGMYVVNKMADNKTKGLDGLYPALSRFNQCQCPHTQTLLAGIYRKTQVPDGFGPLVNMLMKNSQTNSYPKPLFDPNEEIGGAVLEYIKNYAAQGYSKK